MSIPFAFGIGVVLLTASQSITPGQTNSARPMDLFVRVYAVTTADLKPPVTIRLGTFGLERGRLGGFTTLENFSAAVSNTVELEITVGDDGRVRDAMVTKAVNTSLDDFAVRAANGSRFQPGRLNGRPVAVRMPLSLTAATPR